MRFGLVVVCLTFIFAHATLEDSCTAMIVAKQASLDGSVMTTHTNDCLNCDFRLAKIPAADHANGTMRPIIPFKNAYPRFVGEFRGNVYKKVNLERTNIYDQPLYPWDNTVPIGYIPQVKHTYAYLENNYGIMNEHQLAMGESTCGGKLVNRPIFAGGSALLDVTELTRIAMERCKTARCAIKTMGSLAEEFGYYGAEWEGEDGKGEAGEALMIGDPEEAWVFHIHPDGTDRGAVWAAQRVPDDHITAIGNQFIIRKMVLDDPEHFLASSNVISVAIKNGLYNPDTDGEFDFTRAYALPRSHSIYATRRVWRVFTLAAPSLLDVLSPNTTSLADDYPFSVKPDRLVSASDLMRYQRDHYEGTSFDQTVGMAAGPFGNPNRYDPGANGDLTGEEAGQGVFERSISIFRTTHSFVTQSRTWLPRELGKIQYSTYSPHAACYTPVYVVTEHNPSSYEIGSLFAYNPQSAFWAHAAVGNYAERAFRYIIQDVQKKQQEVESDSIQQQDDIERLALQILETGDRAKSLFVLDTFAAEQADYVLDTWHKLFWQLITKYHDGYRMDTLTAKELVPTKLFYPKWWLEQVGFFNNAILTAPQGSPQPQPAQPTPRQPAPQPGQPNLGPPAPQPGQPQPGPGQPQPAQPASYYDLPSNARGDAELIQEQAADLKLTRGSSISDSVVVIVALFALTIGILIGLAVPVLLNARNHKNDYLPLS